MVQYRSRPTAIHDCLRPNANKQLLGNKRLTSTWVTVAVIHINLGESKDGEGRGEQSLDGQTVCSSLRMVLANFWLSLSESAHPVRH